MTFPLFQPLPAASLLPGCADQQQAFPQDSPPAVLPNIVHLLREAVIPSHFPNPPETCAHPVMDPRKGDGIATSGFPQCEKVISSRRISFNEDDMRLG